MIHGITAMILAGPPLPFSIFRGNAIFVVTPRKRGKELISLIQQIDPEAFVTLEPVAKAIGGYLPAPSAAAVRK